jgi:chaperonin GroES
MKARIIKTAYAQYEPVEWSGSNRSGWTPSGDRILVLTDRAPEKLGSIHDEAAITGVLVACGSDAFTWNSDRSRAWAGEKPKPGDRVMFQKYAGELLYGDDGELYRVMDDRAIGAHQRV